MIKCNVTIKKVVYESGDFHIYGADVIDCIYGQVKINRYGNITIKTDRSLKVGNSYEFELIETTDRYGVSYAITKSNLDFSSIDEIDKEFSLRFLSEIMSEKLSAEIVDKYPDFIKLILKGEESQIDIRKIKGVGNKLFDKYVKAIKSKSNSLLIRNRFPNVNLTNEDCDKLILLFSDAESAIEELNRAPYRTLISYCNKRFFDIDTAIGEANRHTFDRIEYMIDAFIRMYEYDGSTYADAWQIADDISNYDATIVKYLKDASEVSDIIHYNSKLNVLQRMITHDREVRFANFINSKLAYDDKLNWDWEQFTHLKGGELTETQRSILKTICENKISILTGYAGTGKTSTIKAIINMIEYYGQTYIMMSPTGKAAMRLSEQTDRPAFTIHKATLNNVLDYDWVIVDEMSMVSLDVMSMIVDASDNPNTRFLFVGDPAQLPSIGLGKIFEDLISCGKIPVVRLVENFRYNEGGASYVATNTRNGKPYLESDKDVSLGTMEDYKFVKWHRDINQIISEYTKLLNSGVNKNDIVILCPQNVGDFGTVKINNIIQDIVNPNHYGKKEFIKTTISYTPVEFRVGDLVMITKNYYNALKYEESIDEDGYEKTQVFNGQIGRIDKVLTSDRSLVISVEGEDVLFCGDMIMNLRLAYASTIHKFQGSSAKHIITLIVNEHRRMLCRELLYTAQTRFEKSIIEIGDLDAITYALNTELKDERKTLLIERING